MIKFKYSEVLAWLREQIASEVFKEGDRLPTESNLMERFDVSRDTVRKALSILEEENMVYRIKGSGTFVNGATRLMSTMTKHTPTKRIGVMMNTVDSYIFTPIVLGIQTTLAQYGYQMALHFTNNCVSQERAVLKDLIEADYDGLIIEPTRAALPNPNFDLYRQISNSIPALTIHAKFFGLQISSLTINDVEAASLMTEYLLEKGHKDIMIAMKFDEQTGPNRYLGYLKALQKHNITVVDDNILFFAGETMEMVFADPLDKRVQEGLERCSAIICQDDKLAAYLTRYLMDNPGKYPNVKQICGFDDFDMGHELGITTSVHPKEKFGEYAARLILEKIENPGKDVSYKFAPKLVIHE